jgi:IPT/TIG domain
MTTRDLSRTVMAAFAALSDRTGSGGSTTPAGLHARAGGTPSSPAVAVHVPSAPAIAVLSPDTGSTGGSTPLKISGSGFQPGAVVLIDGIAMSAFVLDSRTIYACAPPHDAGKADVVVMNPNGSSAMMTNGYTFVSPRLFDFNGDWIGVAGSEHQMELRFTVRDNVLVSVSCGTSGAVTFAPPPRVEHGEFSVVRGDGVGISARIVSATEAVGTINLEPCPYTNWIATRSIKQPGWPS